MVWWYTCGSYHSFSFATVDFVLLWDTMEIKPDLSHVKFDVRVLSSDFFSKVPLLFSPRIELLDLVGFTPGRSEFNLPRYSEAQELQEFKARIEAMYNLKSLKIASFLIPNEIILFKNAPLTTLILDKVLLSRKNFQSITSLIETCRTLFFVSFNCAQPQTLPLLDKSPLFTAINSNASIRKFDFIIRNRVLDRSEMQGVSNLIRQTKTLRDFSLFAEHFAGEQYNELFRVLTKNTSLLSFRAVSDTSPEQDLVTINPILLDTRLIREFLKTNRFLRLLDMTQRFDIFEKLSEYDVEDIYKQAVEAHHLSKFHLGSLQLSKSALEGDIVHYSLRNEASHILKLGRILTFSMRIQGKQLPFELVDNILKQGTSDSIWPNSLWLPIRRAVMDRQTLGRLYSETRHFDAFELAYLCRSIGQ